MQSFARRTADERITKLRRRFGDSSSPLVTIRCSAQRDRQRATSILLIISFTYLICFAPDTICELYFAIKLPSWFSQDINVTDETAFIFFDQFDRLWRFLFQLLTLISYGANFYTYLLFGTRFRKEISALLPTHSSAAGRGVGVEGLQMQPFVRPLNP